MGNEPQPEAKAAFPALSVLVCDSQRTAFLIKPPCLNGQRTHLNLEARGGKILAYLNIVGIHKKLKAIIQSV